MTDAATAYRNTMTEDELMTAIIQKAEVFGWLVMHIPDRLYKLAAKQGRGDAMVGAKGYPDLTLVRPRDGRMLVIECKSARGGLTPEQTTWLTGFAMCRVPSVIATPANLDMVLEALV